MLMPPLVAALAGPESRSAFPEARDGGLSVRRGRDGQVHPHGAGLHERRTASAGRTGGAGRRWSSRLGRGIGRTWRQSGGRRTVGLDAGCGGTDGRSAVAPTAAPVRLPIDGARHRSCAITIAALTVEPVEAGLELAVTVMPRSPGLAVSFVLPAGLEPARSNLPGIVPPRSIRTATYLAPTPDGLVFRASFGRIDAGQLRDLHVVATRPEDRETAPAGSHRRGCQEARTAWTAEAVWIVAPFALPIAPVPPLR